MSGNFGIAVILYHPEPDDLAHLSALIDCGINVLIWDNSRQRSTYGLEQLAIYYHAGGENLGLSVAYNQIINAAKAASIGYLLLLDQDTRLSFAPEDTCSMVSKPIELLQTNKNASAIYLSNNHTEHAQKRIFINSGMLLKLDQYLPRFDEKFFVECVDYAWCLANEVNGRKIMLYNHENLLIHHTDESVGSWGVRWRKYPITRVVEFNAGLIRLLLRSAQSGRIWFIKFFFKSLIKFNLKQIISMVLTK